MQQTGNLIRHGTFFELALLKWLAPAHYHYHVGPLMLDSLTCPPHFLIKNAFVIDISYICNLWALYVRTHEKIVCGAGVQQHVEQSVNHGAIVAIRRLLNNWVDELAIPVSIIGCKLQQHFHIIDNVCGASVGFLAVHFEKALKVRVDELQEVGVGTHACSARPTMSA